MSLLKFNVFEKININFVKYRFVSFTVAFFIIFSTLFSIYNYGINYGIDFKGGHVLEIRTKKAPDLSSLRLQLESINVGDVSIQQIGHNPRDLFIKIEKDDKNPDSQENMIKIKNILGPDVEYRKLETIGPKVGQELIRSAIKSIIIALGFMLLYISVRFQWQFALGAVLALAHDCIGILALFTIFKFDFNESAIIGILITAGYSVNDTIVIFDRIRENLRVKKLTVHEIINLSINQTLSRTVLTVVTTVLSLLAMYYFGGKVIAEFSIPIIVGIVLGTFSSIFVASPLLIAFGLNKKEITA